MQFKQFSIECIWQSMHHVLKPLAPRMPIFLVYFQNALSMAKIKNIYTKLMDLFFLSWRSMEVSLHLHPLGSACDSWILSRYFWNSDYQPAVQKRICHCPNCKFWWELFGVMGLSIGKTKRGLSFQRSPNNPEKLNFSGFLFPSPHFGTALLQGKDKKISRYISTIACTDGWSDRSLFIPIIQKNIFETKSWIF